MMTREEMRASLVDLINVEVYTLNGSAEQVADRILALFDPALEEIGRLAVEAAKDRYAPARQYLLTNKALNDAIAAYLTSENPK